MRILHIIPLALLLVAGCNRNDAERPPETTAPAVDTTPAPITTGNTAAVTMRYACDGDTNIEILGGDKAQVSLPDGRVVELSKVTDSEPPVFAGGSLYFAIGSADANLSQEDGTNELTCRPQ